LEEALDQAEGSITPILVTAILAAMAANALTPDGDDESHLGSVIAKGVLFPTYQVVKGAANGITEYVRGALMLIIHPLIFRRLQSMDRTGQYSGDLNAVARDVASSVIDSASQRISTFTTSTTSTTDIYSMFDRRSTTTSTRSIQQSRVESFSTLTARWLTREAVFGAQERIAATLGFTHKRWISERDLRVRPEHAYLDGTAIPIGDIFHTPTGDIRYPGDLTAPIHLVANCRCSLEWLRR
jgi:hypothetical protein